MQARLEKLKFTSPKAESPWTGPPAPWQHPSFSTLALNEAAEKRFKELLPLFLHEPRWHDFENEQANAIAVALAEIEIPVTALRSEVSSSNGDSALHEATSPDSTYLPRIIPYRPERYGLTVDDFDHATMIDIRLTTHRDETGRFAYSADQLARWDVLKGEVPISGGSWVPSATFPPDVPAIHQLGSKFSQLRALAPNAALFVTLEPFHLEIDLQGVLAAQPDGLILQLDSLALDGLELATMVHKTRELMDRLGKQTTPLWISPGEIGADDAAKLIALGASGVAIDSWFEHLWDEIAASSNSGYASRGHHLNQARRLANEMQWYANRTMGLLHSLNRLPKHERLSSLDVTWCEALNLKKMVSWD